MSLLRAELSEADLDILCREVERLGNKTPAELRASLYDYVPGTLEDIKRRYRTRGALLSELLAVRLEGRKPLRQ